MNKTFTRALIVFLAGMVLTIIGALFKITHWTGATALLTIGMLSQAAALILLIIAIVKMSKNK